MRVRPSIKTSQREDYLCGHASKCASVRIITVGGITVGGITVGGITVGGGYGTVELSGEADEGRLILGRLDAMMGLTDIESA
jgi:hypothetical protein